MEALTANCMRHDRPNELFCKECKTFLCPECVDKHGSDGHKANYMHILSYAKDHTVGAIDMMIEESRKMSDSINEEAKELIFGMDKILPQLLELSTTQIQSITHLSRITKQLLTYAKQKEEVAFERILEGFEKDKKNLEKGMKEKKVKEVLKLAQQVDSESEMIKRQLTPKEILGKINADIAPFMKATFYQPLVEALSKASSKSHYLHLVNYQRNWKCDRQYFSHKMFLSEDGLTFGNTASSGYPAIISDVIFEQGLFAYEAIPTSLCCTGKEGFGIIERDKYLEVFNKDKITPTVYEQMIGLLNPSTARNMTVERVSNLTSGSKYYVKVNLSELWMTLKGPGVSLRAELKFGVTYVPCFSCGCSSNRIKIRPLDSFDEVEDQLLP